MIRLVPFLKHLSEMNDVRPVSKKKLSFDTKEIYIKPTFREASNSTIDTVSATPSKVTERNPADKEREREGKRRYLHAKRNSDLESLVKKEEGASGEETDCKLPIR